MIRNTKVKKGVKTTIVFGMSALMAATPVLSSIPVYAATSDKDSEAKTDDKDTKTDSTVTTDTKDDETAVSKEETVYVKTDASGKVEKTTVSDRLVNAGIYKSVEDVSELSDIENVKGDEEFTSKGKNLIWNSNKDGADIYYQGTTDKELPVGVSFTYYLDGKEMKAEDMVGKSGKVTIKIKYTNNSKKTVKVDGKDIEVSTPFMMLTGLILPVENFSNVEVDHGKVVDDGTRSVVIGYGMPGLADSLKLKELDTSKLDDLTSDDDKDSDKKTLKESIDEIDIPDTIEITADVTDFSLDNSFTIATSDLFTSLDTTDFFSVDEINEKMAEIEDAALKLVDGSKELADGAKTLDSSYGEFDAGIQSLQDGVKLLISGGSTLSSSMTNYTGGVISFASGTTSYINGVDDLASKLNSSIPTLTKGINSLNSGASTLASYFDGQGDTDAVAASAKLAAGTKQMQETLASASDLLSSLPTLVQTGKGLISQATSATSPLINLSTSLTGLTQALTRLKGTLTTLKTNVETTNNQIDAHMQADSEKNAAAIQALQEAKSAIDSLPDTSTSVTPVTTDNGDGTTSTTYEQSDSVNLSPSKEAAKSDIDRAISSLSQDSGSIDKIDTSSIDTCIGTIDSLLNSLSETQSELAPLKENLEKLSSTLDTASQELSKLPASAEQVKAMSDKASQLNAGMQQLNAAISGDIASGIKSLASGTSQLNAGAGQLSSQLSAGLSQLESYGDQLKSYSSILQTSSTQIASGSNTFIAGISTVGSGTDKLKSASSQIASGISQLSSGASQLADGTSQFNKEAIEKITSLFDGNLEDILDRVKALKSDEAQYTNYSGCADGMDSSVKFIIESAAID